MVTNQFPVVHLILSIMSLSRSRETVLEEGTLSRMQKRLMTSLYTTGKKIQATKSHINFLKTCENEKFIPVGFQIKENRFKSSKEEQKNVILELVKLEEKQFEENLKVLEKSLREVCSY